MNIAELDLLLHQEDEYEIRQKMDYIASFKESDAPNRIKRESLFDEGNIHISKHPRYAPVPEHSHEFVELNYMYAGSCSQEINGEKIVLEQGDLLLIDRDATQRIEHTGEKDILINILLREETISTSILSNLVSNTNLVSSFMVNASTDSANHTHFLLFSGKESEALTSLMTNMLLANFGPHIHKTKTLNLYLSLILMELTDLYDKRNQQHAQNKENSPILQILDCIDKNYPTISLDTLSERFGYNQAYLSNKLKKEAGNSFQELLNRKRFSVAYELITESNLSMEEVSHRIGYEETASLYKLFRKYETRTPKEIRKSSSPA
ncbi:AraC family transcriptional regulator [uncultured Trichococcus sp.]|uniref:AraC family transcriptional regulator n=1 Tax=uncultured Trichococcus sp. TaxID=189665 RepID=UPI002A18E06B|nr:AraC family transcriptional regulator [uncultured Trichococcus sp.]